MRTISLHEMTDLHNGICGKARDSLLEFSTLEEDELNSAVMMAALLSNKEGVSESDLGILLKWANGIQRECVTLHLALSGIVDISVQENKVAIRLRESPDLIDRFRAAGLTENPPPENSSSGETEERK